jgi:tetratricopeptide (TPR) repeat protein
LAKHGRKHAREVRRDPIREKTLSFFDQLGDRLEGRGKALLYGLVGLVVVAALLYAFASWREAKANEARQALARAIDIAGSPVAGAESPEAPAKPGAQTFASERERAQRAVEEFQKVADKYKGEPYHSQANYFKAANLLTVDRQKGLSELDALTKSGDREVSAWAKFALAQARENDAQYDGAAALYKELASVKDDAVVPTEIANLRLASVLEKQGKKSDAADILFNIVKASREAKDKDGKAVPPSSAARDADQKLEQLDPDRHSKLPPEPPRDLAG